ncbi:DUF2796 domain-containing protein [Nisaea denitrificans]|uniref:DUF2796 domain-containing protein n=1 Tax=Nisaea denitrificans TaxID=390877 RepID=UPI000A041780|nr:DUF2796 domain-containing protein [Nisaea denitrificans]
MTRLPYILAVMLTVTNTMAAASETRQADAHEHGHGQLTIAIEGATIEMEIEIPGADIVGFEHAPETVAQHEAFDAGKAKLAKGGALFSVIGEAGCTLQESRFMEEDDHNHDKKSSDAEHDGEHMEFHVTFRFSCMDTAKIAGFSFPFFKQFPNSEELDVQIVSPKGQFQFEVSPDHPTLTLD